MFTETSGRERIGMSSLCSRRPVSERELNTNNKPTSPTAMLSYVGVAGGEHHVAETHNITCIRCRRRAIYGRELEHVEQRQRTSESGAESIFRSEDGRETHPSNGCE